MLSTTLFFEASRTSGGQPANIRRAAPPLFDVLMLVSRAASGLAGPLLAKRVESGVLAGTGVGGVGDFRWLILAASVATIVGGLLTPTFQRLFTRAVAGFAVHRSLL